MRAATRTRRSLIQGDMTIAPNPLAISLALGRLRQALRGGRVQGTIDGKATRAAAPVAAIVAGMGPWPSDRDTMTCREFADFVLAYVEQTLSADERLRFEHHLTICPDCVRYLQQYHDTIAAARLAADADDDSLPSDIPDDLVKAILDARRR
jgi:hypothetical protein